MSKPSQAAPAPITISQLLDESVHLLRRTPTSGLAAYATGVVPFVLVMLYFFATMSRDPDAMVRLPVGAMICALAYIWMKSWQSVFCGIQLATLQDQPAPRLSLRRFGHIAVVQGIVQSAGLVVLPLCIAPACLAFLALLIPFFGPFLGIAWAMLIVAGPFARYTAYYHGATVYGSAEEIDYDTVRSRASRVGKLWHKQNAILIWLLSPWPLVFAAAALTVILPGLKSMANDFAAAWLGGIMPVIVVVVLAIVSPIPVMIAVMLAVVIGSLPFLLRTFTGIESIMTMSGEAWQTTSFMAIVVMLTYVLLDPIIKSAYVLRSFYGLAIDTGEDLRAELSRQRRSRKLAVALLVIGTMLCAAPASAVEPGDLDHAIEDVMDRPEYRYRAPREGPILQVDTDTVIDETWTGKLREFLSNIGESISTAIENTAESIGDAFEKFGDWIDSLIGPRTPTVTPPAATGGGITAMISALFGSFSTVMILLAGALLIVIIIVIVMILRRAKLPEVTVAEVVTAQVVTEEALANEEIAPDAMPESEWRAMAADLIDRGEYRLAMRALYLASLSYLGEHRLVALRKSKSNREYMRELDRRAHALPTLVSSFRDNVRYFEGAWYGEHSVSRDGLDQFIENLDRIRAGVQS